MHYEVLISDYITPSPLFNLFCSNPQCEVINNSCPTTPINGACVPITNPLCGIGGCSIGGPGITCEAVF